MFCGFDFGTSNCSIGTIINNEVKLIPIDGDDFKMKSLLWAKKKIIKRKFVTDTDVDLLYDSLVKSESSDLLKRLFGSNRRIDGLSPTEKILYNRKFKEMSIWLRAKARNLLERDAASSAEQQYLDQTIDSIEGSTLSFGSAAFHNHCIYPNDGIFFKSPKIFLGSDLSGEHLARFEKIVLALVSHIKEIAELNTNNEFDSVVFGKPVQYSLLRNSYGNFQALEIMRNAAKIAGFKNVEFEFEPIAAALDFESSLSNEKLVLVVDIGGGTTDVTMMKLDPKRNNINDRKDDILAYDGERVGGNDIDFNISYFALCRYLGKESLNFNKSIVNNRSPIPSHIYYDAMSIYDVNAQARFFNSDQLVELALKQSKHDSKLNKRIKRLKLLQLRNLVYQFNSTAESLKLNLSENEVSMYKIDYLGDAFDVKIDRKIYEFYMKNNFDKIRKVIEGVCSDVGNDPDYVYVTGGSSKSLTLLENILPRSLMSKVVYGDSFGSVGKGLVVAANNRFS